MVISGKFATTGGVSYIVCTAAAVQQSFCAGLSLSPALLLLLVGVFDKIRPENGTFLLVSLLFDLFELMLGVSLVEPAEDPFDDFLSFALLLLSPVVPLSS